jgi:hypothetical protein
MAWSWHRSTTSNLAVSLTAILLVRYPTQWHGIGLNNATSNLAEPLTAMSSNNSNNNSAKQNTQQSTEIKFEKKSEVKIARRQMSNFV